MSLRPRAFAPIIALSANLIATYTNIQNAEVAARPQPTISTVAVPSANDQFEYKIRHGEVFRGRYRVLGALGKGAFGNVVKCHDTQENIMVALKVIKSHPGCVIQARRELDLLLELNNTDSEDQYGTVRLLDHFMHQSHPCMVFELLSCSLYELVKRSQSLSLNLIRKISLQLLHTLQFLSSESVDIIHCDLKPENILLRAPDRSAIKLIDFGSSCRRTEKAYSYIQSRYYRAPEVLLGLEYDQAVDMWSVGCILMELHLGTPLLPGKSSGDQMAFICGLAGLPPRSLLQKGAHTNQFFSATSGVYSLLPGLHSERLDLMEMVGMSANASRWRGTPGHSDKDYSQFLDLVGGMLQCDPAQRLTPREAAQHPFFCLDSAWQCDAPTKDYPSQEQRGRKRRAQSYLLTEYASSPRKIPRRDGGH